MSRDPVPLSNTPWWLPEVTLGGGDGLTRQRCNPYGHETGGPKHLEGGVYSPEHEPYTWYCEAVADARYRAECVHGHRGQQMWLCNGHRMMLAKRAMGVCPPCAWPPKALRLHEQMNAIRYGAAVMDERGQKAAVDMLWRLQDEMNDLASRGLIHRCPLTLVEVS